MFHEESAEFWRRGGTFFLEEVLYSDIFGQKITSMLVNILLAHHPHFLFWFHTVLFFSCHTHHYFSWIQEIPRQSLPTVLTSQRDKVLSAELVTAVLEKGRNSMLFTEPLWPRRVYLHLSLQEKKTGMQHTPLRVIWSTDNFRWMKNTFCASPQLLSGKMNIDSDSSPEHCTTETVT